VLAVLTTLPIMAQLTLDTSKDMCQVSAENGGQYTHAALWTIIAAAQLGDGDRAGELFACSIQSTMPQRALDSTDTASNHMLRL